MWKCVFITALCAGLTAAGSVKGHGQDAAPATEIFVGVSKLWQHIEAPPEVGGGPYDNTGLRVAATRNINSSLGVETDLVRFTDKIPTDHFRLLVGPHLAYNANSRVSPFAHALLGLTRDRLCSPTSCEVNSELTGRNAFTTAIGGGVDVKVFRFFWIRPIEVDYVHAFFAHAPGLGTAPENNLELSYGFAFRFGSVGKARKQ